jgi:signal transduction histidine kinase/ActR/RegA family two-component response regulator
LRLQHCIRDLAALNALPAMCVGASPDKALAIVLEALPTALSADLVYLSLPGTPGKQRARVRQKELDESELSTLRDALDAEADGTAELVLPGAGKLWCYGAELPMGAARGRLVAGRVSPLDRETDRVLVGNAANLVGTALESANVLETAHRKDEFLAMLGHELRNPLAPIVTAVELLARIPSATREREIIERHAHHLARLVDDLLDISRVTRGYIELKYELVSLASVLERAVEIASPLILRQRHTLYVADAGAVTLRGDAVRLAQIFGNLLTNAAKFTPAPGRIDVIVEEGPERVRVSVRDNGRGIEQSQLARIFEPFVQADRGDEARGGGLGLGLAIVANLVGHHGGSISAESAGRGLGSTFTVELPTAVPVESPMSVDQRKAVGARAGVRVLVVDDNVDIAELIAEALAAEGYETAMVHDARAAIERWRTFDPHAAVLDVGLPELDGYELARLLREEHGTRPTLIAATGYGQEKDRALAVGAGFNFHFVKPVSIHDLVLALDERLVSGGGRQTPTA